MNLLKICVALALYFTRLVVSKKNCDKFPKDFLLGAATSALQVEGAWNIDGKGPNIWDIFTHEHPEKIADGSNTGDVANSYEFYENDVKCAKEMGVSIFIISPPINL